MFLYDWLLKFGFADEVEADEGDRKQAFAKYMHRVAIGLVNQYTAFNVRKRELTVRKLISWRTKLPGKGKSYERLTV